MVVGWQLAGYLRVEGNEMADELARKGVVTRFVGSEPFCLLAASTCSQDRYGKRRGEKKAGILEETPSPRQAKIPLADFNRRRYDECMITEDMTTIGKNGLLQLVEMHSEAEISSIPILAELHLSTK